MSRQSFWLGFCSGALTLAIALMGVQYWPQESPQAPYVAPPQPQPTVTTVSEQETKGTPYDWQRHEFNGQVYYIVPLAGAADDQP